MKRFDYWCKPCENKFEEIITSDMIVECPKCKNDKVRRLMSAPMVHMI
jgi:putative FmdB family regulatory protein